MTIKNVYLKNGIDRSKHVPFGHDSIAPDNWTKGQLRIIKINELYSKERERGELYYFDNCECNVGKHNGSYHRVNPSYKDDSCIHGRMICEWCDKERKFTLRCFDYVDLLPFFASDLNYKLYLKIYGVGFKDIEEELLKTIRENIYSYGNCGKSLKFLREWTKRLAKWENTTLSPFLKAISELDDLSLPPIIATNLVFLWD